MRNVFSWEGYSENILWCNMHLKSEHEVLCMQETFFIEKEFHQASCALPHSWRVITKCSVCEKRFFLRKEFIRHLVMHHAAKEWPRSCSVCKKLFFLGKKFIRHLVMQHAAKDWPWNVVYVRNVYWQEGNSSDIMYNLAKEEIIFSAG